MKKAYNQKNCTVLVDGIPLKDLAEGDTIRVRNRGGEVDLTEGTDGAAINIATDQGGEIEVDLKPTSTSRLFLNSLRLAQQQSSIGCNIVVMEGTEAVETLATAFINPPGERTNGGKKMNKITYKFVGTVLTGSNL